ncbi:hypothetical protein K1719_047317 [Acacia pycnantha]|nr:hypothetical protein K1719_047317 [Acacia pycnantha]
MAKNNKYTPINFNLIYDKNSSSASNTNLAKNPAPSLSPSYSAASYSAISAPNKTHGRMLVLTRPTPKPLQSQPQHPPQQQLKLTQQVPDQPPSNSDSDAISSSIGSYGNWFVSRPCFNYDKDKELPHAPPVVSPKSDKFVPPHLRPGFVPRENKPGPELSRPQRHRGHAGYPSICGKRTTEVGRV